MSFNSFAYLLFLPLAVGLFAAARARLGPRAAQGCLVVASLVFYGWSRPASLPLLAGSIVVSWGISQWLCRTAEAGRRRWILVLGLALNIGFLCLFKYVHFFCGGLGALGLAEMALPDWGFPLGISFFTLQQIMYLVDCYEGLIPANDLRDHAAFVTFFPTLVSGPLTRARSIVTQLHGPGLKGEERHEQIARGVHGFALGLFKKVVFADSFGRVADAGYAAAGECSTVEVWVFSLAYTFQIYFDFSGYSDMAIGSARLLGIEIPRNFNAPYRARSVTEFWQRWHISLSSFITTYLYTPILRSFEKATPVTAAVATMVAMAIAGSWHGPSWGFVLFGVLHGSALVLHQAWKRRKKKLPGGLSWGLTFAFVNLTFVFFRAPDLATALHFVALLLPVHDDPFEVTTLHDTLKALKLSTIVPTLVAGVVGVFAGKTSDELTRDFRPSYRSSLATAMLVLVALVHMNSRIAKQFVYFNF